MNALLDAPLAIVDLETTGMHPADDRITEIAVVEVEGGAIAGEWSTLVNPQAPIPPAIQALTGITQAMVADAPPFSRIAAALHERLANRILVAHNARFDYGFLRHEFGRAGVKFAARTLCTVKLSRRLYPEHAQHNLDSVIARHRLACATRHRALGDARVVWQFLHAAAEEHGPDAVSCAIRQIVRQPALPAHIDPALIDSIPEAPGVYLFYGEAPAPLYIGKSARMRARVRSHFSDDLRSSRAMQLARQVRRVEWQRTAGELGALLREAALVKTHLPAFNRQLRRPVELCGFALEPHRDPAHILRLVRADGLHGSLVTALHGLADEHGLCLQTLGFDLARPGKGACFRHQLGRCSGVCAGRESAPSHLARVAAAVARLPSHRWPYRGAIGIVEQDRECDATEVHVVDHWCWLGTARNDAEVAELLEGTSRPGFDLDQHRILSRHLARPGARVVELH